MSKRIVPWIVFSVFLLYVGVAASGLPHRSGHGFDLAGFRRLPVSVSGRVQPIDTVARIALTRIRGSVSVPLTGAEAKQAGTGALDPDYWLLEVLAKPDTADERAIFPIGDLDLIGKLSLVPSRGKTSYYAFRDFADKVEEISRQTARVSKIAPGNRAAWEREILLLHERLVLYERLKNSVQPNSSLQREAKGNPVAFDFPQLLGSYRVDLMEAVKVAGRRKDDKTATLDRETERRLRAFSAAFVGVSRVALIAAIPPHQGELRSGWTNVGTEIISSARGGKLSPALAYLARMASAFARGDTATFNAAVAAQQKWLASNGLAREASRAGVEVFYNDFEPFFRAVPLYLLGVILLCAARGSRPIQLTAALLILIAFALHTAGILFAFKLAGRPAFPAFAGWATALCGLVIEWFSRRGLGVGVAGGAGVIGLATTYALAPGGGVAFLRTVFDVNLLVAVLATVVALSILGLSSRWTSSRPTTPGTGNRWYSSYYFAARRMLRAE